MLSRLGFAGEGRMRERSRENAGRSAEKEHNVMINWRKEKKHENYLWGLTIVCEGLGRYVRVGNKVWGEKKGRCVVRSTSPLLWDGNKILPRCSASITLLLVRPNCVETGLTPPPPTPALLTPSTSRPPHHHMHPPPPTLYTRPKPPPHPSPPHHHTLHLYCMRDQNPHHTHVHPST